MGNRQAKAAKTETPAKDVSEPQETESEARSSAKPEEEVEAPPPDSTPTDSPETDPSDLTPPAEEKPSPPEEDKLEAKEQEEVKTKIQTAEEVEEAEGKLTVPEIPPLSFTGLNQPSVGEEVVEEEDPDLMKPPPLLTNATGALVENPNVETVKINSPVKHTESTVNEQVMLSAPITHDQVVMDEPLPASDPEIQKQVPDPDAISIEEEISTVAEEEGIGGVSKTSSMALEELSVTSSAIRNDEEYMKGIMGASLNVPDATSNESVIGSVAVSEQTLDESLWDNASQTKVCPKEVVSILQKEDVVYFEMNVQEESIGVVLTSLEAQEKLPEKELKAEEATVVSPEFQKEIILEEKEEEIAEAHKEVKNLVGESVVSTLSESKEIAAVDVEKGEVVVVDLKAEESGQVQVVFSVVRSIDLESYASLISDKQVSVELNTPFERLGSGSEQLSSQNEAVAVVEESTEKKEGAEEKLKEEKLKKPKKSGSLKSPGSKSSAPGRGSGLKSPTSSTSMESTSRRLSPSSSGSAPGSQKYNKSSSGKGKRGKGRKSPGRS